MRLIEINKQLYVQNVIENEGNVNAATYPLMGADFTYLPEGVKPQNFLNLNEYNLNIIFIHRTIICII